MAKTAQLTSAEEAGKVAALKDFAAEYGWRHGSIRRPKDEPDVVILRLKPEKGDSGPFVEIRWDGNAIKERPIISDGHQLKYLQNVAGVKRHISASDDDRAGVFAEKTRGTRKAGAEASGKAKEKKQRVNFSLTDDDETVLAALKGRKICWKSRLSGEYEEDYIDPYKNTRHFRIEDFDDNRQVHFVGEMGFRAAYLNQIVTVR